MAVTLWPYLSPSFFMNISLESELRQGWQYRKMVFQDMLDIFFIQVEFYQKGALSGGRYMKRDILTNACQTKWSQ